VALLRLSVSSIELTTTWALSREDGRPDSRDALRLGIVPESGEYLQLKTGETFCHPSNAGSSNVDRSRIAASLVIEQVDSDDDSAGSKLRYLAETGTDRTPRQSAIEFHWCLPSEGFYELLSNIRSGLLPTKAAITLQHEIVEGGAALRFNLEADGRGIKWDNDNAAARKLGINIEQVTLQFRSLGRIGENESKAIDLQSEVRDQFTRIGSELRRIGVVLISGIVALVIATLIRH
jgi:hypothetical protein